jgi:plasmid stability protein
MPDVLVRDVQAEVVESLKHRAAFNGRSLQAELKIILEQAAQSKVGDARKLAAKIRRSLKDHKLNREEYSDSAALLAEDRRR